MDSGYRVIDHTADVGIEATAPELDSLFDRCAAGMFSLIVEDAVASAAGGAPDVAGDVEPEGARAVEYELELTAFDLPELLIAWLRELLWQHHEAGWLYSGARFAILEPERLAATAIGRLPVPGRQTVVRELKAVTYHELAVERRGDGWYAQVIFDV